MSLPFNSAFEAVGAEVASHALNSQLAVLLPAFGERRLIFFLLLNLLSQTGGVDIWAPAVIDW